MKTKKLYVLSFCAIKREDINSDSVKEDYTNICVSPDKKFLSSLIECMKLTDEFRDLLLSFKSSGFNNYLYRYRITEFPLMLVL